MTPIEKAEEIEQKVIPSNNAYQHKIFLCEP